VIDKYQQNKHITSHLKSVNTKNTATYDVRNPDPGLVCSNFDLDIDST